MIGAGLLFICLLIGLRLSLRLVRYRSVAIFVLIVGAVAIMSISSARTIGESVSMSTDRDATELTNQSISSTHLAWMRAGCP